MSVPGLAAVLEIPKVGTLIAQSDRQLGGPGRISCLDALRAAVAGFRNARRSTPASLTLVAYRWLERSVLVSLLLGQVLLFWQGQLGAMVELGWNLLLLGALRFAIRQEEARLGLSLAQEGARRFRPETGVQR